MSSDKLKEVVADSLTPRLSDAEFEAAFEGWAFIPYGDLMGVAMVKGTEFHFTPTSEFRFDRALMRKQFAPILSQYGMVTTRVQHGDTKSRRINKLFGFKTTWADERFEYSIITALPFKEKLCQQ